MLVFTLSSGPLWEPSCISNNPRPWLRCSILKELPAERSGMVVVTVAPLSSAHNPLGTILSYVLDERLLPSLDSEHRE